MEQQSQSPSQPQLDLNSLQLEKDENTPDSDVSQVYIGPEDELSPDKGLGVVKTIHKLKHSKKKYHTISDDNRQKLIDAVENRGEKIKHAAKRLSINYSSAKSICQVFKKEGRTDKKTFKKRGGKEEVLNDVNIKPAMVASITSLHNLDFGSDAIQNAETMSFSEEPEKDTLKILRDRLLESRASRLRQHLQSDGDLYQQVKKENICQGQQQYSSSAFSQLQQLDDVIAQNNRILGESPEPWKKSFISDSSLSNLKSQSTLSPIQGSMEVIQNETYNNTSPPQNMQNGLAKQIININQPQAYNLSIQNFGQNDNSFNHNNPQLTQQNPLFPQNFMSNNNQQFVYMTQNNNGNQGLSFNTNMGQTLISNQQQQQQHPNGLQMYQPIVYLIAQPNSNQTSAASQVYMNGAGNFMNPQAGLGQANNNNMVKQNFSIFQKPLEGNPYTGMLGNEMQNPGGFLNMQNNTRQNQ